MGVVPRWAWVIRAMPRALKNSETERQPYRLTTSEVFTMAPLHAACPGNSNRPFPGRLPGAACWSAAYPQSNHHARIRKGITNIHEIMAVMETHPCSHRWRGGAGDVSGACLVLLERLPEEGDDL